MLVLCEEGRKMLILQNNVEIIKGAKLFCIYNLNTGKMYSLDSLCIEYLMSLINDDSEVIVPEDIKEYFLKEGILVDGYELVDELVPYEFDGKVIFAWIEITQNCNLICRHCYENASREARKQEMTVPDFKYVIDKLQESGVKRIQLVGGEPLIHSQIKELVKYVTGKFDSIEIYTNGTLLNDEMIEYFKRNNISLAFSVYSDEACIHDYVTQTKGSYEITSRNIKKVIEKGIKIRVASVEMKGISKFDFFDKTVPYRSDLPRLTGRADLSLYNVDMLRRKLITKETFKKPISADTYFKNKQCHNCFGDRFYIDCNMNVYPCAMERRVVYGNMKDHDVKELISGEMPRMTKDKINGCKDCEYRYACYDCRADSNNSPIDGKPWYCTYNPEDGTWMDKEKFVQLLLNRQSVINSI